jgi:hypothetical protein
MPGILKSLFNRTQAQRCPNCDAAVAADSINIKEGVALCPQCGQLTRLSELNYSTRSEAEILREVPRGCRIESTGQVVTIAVSHRSIPAFLGCCVFAAFWNGIVSIFVLQALAGIYFNAIGPLPDWFPAAGAKNGVPMMNEEPMAVGATVFLCLFLVPFIVVGMVMIVAALFYLAGRVMVVIDEAGSMASTGISIFRWRQKFDARVVQAIHMRRNQQSEEGVKNKIEIVADRTAAFGSSLPLERAEWLWVVLKNLLLQRPIQHPIPDILPVIWLQNRK